MTDINESYIFHRELIERLNAAGKVEEIKNLALKDPSYLICFLALQKVTNLTTEEKIFLVKKKRFDFGFSVQKGFRSQLYSHLIKQFTSTHALQRLQQELEGNNNLSYKDMYIIKEEIFKRLNELGKRSTSVQFILDEEDV